MARNFSVAGSGINTSGVGLLGVVSTAAIVPSIYDIMIGSRATPGDQACTYDVARSTGAGTGGSAVTPNPLDTSKGYTASTSAGYQNSTSVATKGAILLSVSLNQRATFRWVAAPGSELVNTIGANVAIYIWSLTPTAAYVVETCMLFFE